jgi:hypothetical protein
MQNTVKTQLPCKNRIVLDMGCVRVVTRMQFRASGHILNSILSSLPLTREISVIPSFMTF